jgi:methylmalonyl-CoA/ethylmalonyl-CoA epimerase
MIGRLACVSVAVKDLAKARKTFTEGLGLRELSGVQDSQRGFGLQWIEYGVNDQLVLEVLGANGPGPVERFLSRNGEGLYQVRLQVDNVDNTLAELRSRGVRVITDDTKPEGGVNLGWIHPSSAHGVLFELVE